MRRLVVSRIAREARGILGLHLRSRDGAMLPAFEAGAHVDVALGNGQLRQYSLCGDPAELSVYRLGVGLAPDSRGGSRYIHEQLREGDLVEVSEPRQLFGLHAQAAGHVFIAGGIGITPILSMIHACERRGEPWRLLYCVRERDAAAYLSELAVYGERVDLHVDSERHGARCDLDAYLGARQDPGLHVYCCGPAPLMDAVATACERRGIAAARVHFERFAAVAEAAAHTGEAFLIKLVRSGGSHEVPPHKSVLDVLQAAGVAWPHSCREGLCRSCEAGVLSGNIDHRDYVLSDEERAAGRSMMVCVSRGCGTLELDV
ncbi:ferredoxin [Achromobacter sp. RTa]|uniref:PDR/VanB family oxidoreductase n=1 Tax=Achromobacter sp. RTa TaxID=1532557 RepID=UPI00050FD0D5|nr:PDR/VanB family oxidoreductase [Achromobacter sp. RTa]KGD86722.1 ferredoxin [Achromobacter sp. RTa]